MTREKLLIHITYEFGGDKVEVLVHFPSLQSQKLWREVNKRGI